MLTAAPLMARIGVTRIVGDRFAAQAGSIEQDPEGRLMMPLAQNLDIQNLFLVATLDLSVIKMPFAKGAKRLRMGLVGPETPSTM
jgi:hypothetical protein